ncbi:MAG: hypothetical protein HN348_26325, partial [Proteobacteria bacterium]|nr:hypothetical protein [Pseudomonadota bacterium]
MRYYLVFAVATVASLLAGCSSPEPDTDPVVTIISPEEHEVFDPSGGPLLLCASIEDDYDALGDLVVTATSDEDGELTSTGDEVTACESGNYAALFNLSDNKHLITLTATDSASHKGSDTVLVKTPANSAPTCELTGPDHESMFPFGDTVPFEAKVSDPESAANTLNVTITSNIDLTVWQGYPNETGLVTADLDLTVGLHTLNLDVEDGRGLNAQYSGLKVDIVECTDIDGDGFLACEDDCDDE